MEIPDPVHRRPFGRIRADPERILQAACREVSASSHSCRWGSHSCRCLPELINLAEFIGAPVVTTFMGKGVIPEDHPLTAYYRGAKGSDVGNKVTREADLIIAIGCRFSDQSTSSYKLGVTYSIPPTRLIHIDIDPAEIERTIQLK